MRNLKVEFEKYYNRYSELNKEVEELMVEYKKLSDREKEELVLVIDKMENEINELLDKMYEIENM